MPRTEGILIKPKPTPYEKSEMIPVLREFIESRASGPVNQIDASVWGTLIIANFKILTCIANFCLVPGAILDRVGNLDTFRNWQVSKFDQMLVFYHTKSAPNCSYVINVRSVFSSPNPTASLLQFKGTFIPSKPSAHSIFSLYHSGMVQHGLTMRLWNKMLSIPCQFEASIGSN